jgi:hypothetical protein
MLPKSARPRQPLALGIVILLALNLGALAMFAGAEDERPRTQYEGLDLSSPTTAVETFVALFQHGDYPALFLALSPTAQRNWQQYPAVTFDYSVWFENPDALLDEVAFMNRDLPDEHAPNVITALFDEVMVAAAANDAFVIDLRGAVTVQGERMLPVEEPEVAEVTAEVEGIAGEVRFLMERAPSGRWRVRQVIVPGGDETILPWSAVYD